VPQVGQLPRIIAWCRSTKR